VLSHMAQLVRFARSPRPDFDLVDQATNNTHVIDACGTCKTPVACEDCYRIQAVKGDTARLRLERHRTAVADFTIARVEHFKKLGKFVDEAVRVLTAARLVPLDVAAGQQAGVNAVNEMIRKAQPASSLNHFTRLRKSQVEREAAAQNSDVARAMLDNPNAGLAVAPESLDEKRERLMEMVASTHLNHLSPAVFPSDEMEYYAAYTHTPRNGHLRSRGGTRGGAGAALDEELDAAFGPFRDAGPHVPAFNLSTTRGAGSQLTASAPHTARLAGATAVPRPPRLLTADAARESTARRVEEHLPDLFGARSGDAVVRHMDRLDALRRHQTKLSAQAPRNIGGGPGSSRFGSDARHGFTVTHSPRTLTERVLGRDYQMPEM
jgi:hypothetical protein